MKISIVCSNPLHPVMKHLHEWRNEYGKNHEVEIFTSLALLSGGDLLFLVSCSEFLNDEIRERFRFSVVLHASDLPIGKGWSPHVWQIIEGSEQITVTALNACEKIDSGEIWKKTLVHIPKDALHDEINNLIFDAETGLMGDVVEMIGNGGAPVPQPNIPSTYYRRRLPSDSEIDPHRSIAEQFNLLRVCDPSRFPAFFRLHGKVYKITLTKEHTDAE